MRLFKSWKVYMMVAIATGLLMPSINARAEEPSLSSMFSRIQDNAARFSGVEIAFSYEIANEQAEVASKGEMVWRKRDDQERLDAKQAEDEKGRLTEHVYQNYFDGVNMLLFEPKRGTATLRAGKFFQPLGPISPSTLFLLSHQGRSMISLMKEAGANPKIVAEETVEGNVCEVVQFDFVVSERAIGYDVKLYLAKDLGFMPIKFSIDDKDGHQGVIVLSDFSTESGKVFPQKIIYSTYVKGKLDSQIRVSISSVKFLTVGDDFSIKLPPGVFFNDMILEKSYRTK